MNIELHTFPHGQQLSDGELVQVQVAQSGRLVFKDIYFHELQDGDVYCIPEQVEIPLCTDTEILDFMLSDKIKWMLMDYGSGFKQKLIIYDKETNEDYAQADFIVPEGFSHEEHFRGLFRELVTDVINNQEL